MIRVGMVLMSYPGPVSKGAAATLAENVATALARGWGVRIDTPSVQPVDVARNQAVRWARDAGCSHLLMQDADTWVVPGSGPVGVLMREIGDAAAIAAVYQLRGRGVASAARLEADATYECAMVGAGLMLIALDHLPARGPWFKTETTADGCDVTCGEDGYFCRRIRAEGGTILATTKLQTRHDQVTALTLSM